MADRRPRMRGNDPKFDAARTYPGMRKLVLRGETWHWRFGNHMSIRDPRGQGWNVSLSEMLGRNWDDLERASWKRSLSVEPSEVIDHIERRILGYTNQDGFPTESPWRGHQVPVRDGWVAVDGPRGVWQVRHGVWITDIRSPEDVKMQARTYEILGMDIHDWTTIKVEHMKSLGTSLDDLAMAERAKPYHLQTDKVRLLMEYEAPATPIPTIEQLREYIVRHVAVPLAAAQAA
jgi:hypothetical protein